MTEPSSENQLQTVTEVTRRAILDEIELEGITWWGDMDEVDFLSRLYDLEKLPSHDHRYKTASGDIFQHRVNNNDWDDRWVFKDSRFNLSHDDAFLRLLAESLHPVVRRDREKVTSTAALFNRHLVHDGWELAPTSSISGRPVFSPRRLIPNGRYAVASAKTVADTVDADYIHRQISRLENAIDSDPELAIGTAKEFVESVCYTILESRGKPATDKPDLHPLVKRALEELKLVPDVVTDATKGAKSVKAVLGNLSSIVQGLAELRNLYGTGHGKKGTTKGLSSRHARLAVGAATTLAVFLYSTHSEREVTP